MIRTQILAAAALALMGSAASAQPAGGDAPGGPPAQLSGPDSSYDNGPVDRGDYDNDGPGQDEDRGPPPGSQPPPQAQEQASRDMFCRRDAAARTGYVTPGEAASNEQARGTIGGTLGGAALGAIIGGASGHAGTGAAIGAGAGLVAGTAVGASNAQAAAGDVQARYAEAYYACMNEAEDDGPPPQAAAGYGPPPAYYGPYPYAYPYYYAPYPYYYGPGVTFGFGFGGGWHHGWHHWH